MTEIRKKILGTESEIPPAEDEPTKIRDRRTLTPPGRRQTSSAVLSDLPEMVRCGLPDTDWDCFAGRVRSLSLSGTKAQAVRELKPGQMVSVAVGDRAVIEKGVRVLGFGEVRHIDADGSERQ